MKRLFAAVLICFTLLSCLTGCNFGKLNNDLVDENFFCKIKDENNVAIGNVKTYPETGAVFFPAQVQGYTVS